MSAAVIFAAVWIFAPVFLLCVCIAAAEWYEQRKWRRDQRTWQLVLSLDESTATFAERRWGGC